MFIICVAISYPRNNTLMPEGMSVLPDPNVDLATSPSEILIDVKVSLPHVILLYRGNFIIEWKHFHGCTIE